MRYGNWWRFPLVAVVLTMALVTQACAWQEPRDHRFSPRELDSLLAPIALYPDPLLSQILMASTYPLEVVEAARWSAARPGLEGAEAVRAAERMGWDPSVQALVAFPEVLARMDQNLDWTQDLGDAYLLQEPDVIDAIQRLRDEAYAAGYLESLEYARTYRDRDLIIIEPRHAEVVYVPYYDPLVLFAGWWRPYHSHFYWGPPRGYHPRHHFYWGHGVAVAPVFFYSTFHWRERHIVIVDRDHYRPHHSRGGDRRYLSDARRWRHDPVHRRGAQYRHPLTRETYRDFDRARDLYDDRRDPRDNGRQWRDPDRDGDGRRRDSDDGRDRDTRWGGSRDNDGPRQGNSGFNGSRDGDRQAARERDQRPDRAIGNARDDNRWRDRDRQQRQEPRTAPREERAREVQSRGEGFRNDQFRQERFREEQPRTEQFRTGQFRTEQSPRQQVRQQPRFDERRSEERRSGFSAGGGSFSGSSDREARRQPERAVGEPPRQREAMAPSRDGSANARQFQARQFQSREHPPQGPRTESREQRRPMMGEGRERDGARMQTSRQRFDDGGARGPGARETASRQSRDGGEPRGYRQRPE